MSTRERAHIVIDSLTDEQLAEFIAMYTETPNAETIGAMQELSNGGGTLFTGTAEDLFKELSED